MNNTLYRHQKSLITRHNHTMTNTHQKANKNSLPLPFSHNNEGTHEIKQDSSSSLHTHTKLKSCNPGLPQNPFSTRPRLRLFFPGGSPKGGGGGLRIGTVPGHIARLLTLATLGDNCCKRCCLNNFIKIHPFLHLILSGANGKGLRKYPRGAPPCWREERRGGCRELAKVGRFGMFVSGNVDLCLFFSSPWNA